MRHCVHAVIVLFFFSIRRRHTRCLSDWSSDVCSSDLLLAGRDFTWHDDGKSPRVAIVRSEEHTSELQSLRHLVCRLLLEKKKIPPPRAYRHPRVPSDRLHTPEAHHS